MLSVNSLKSAVQTAGTVGLGLAVVGTQVGLIASAAVTSILLDSYMYTKDAGSAAVARGVAFEKSVEQSIYSAIETSRSLARIPGEKFNEHANGFLDIANAIVDNYFHLPLDDETERPADSNVTERIQRLARRLAHLLQTRAQEDILEPCQRQLNTLTDQLRKSLALVDVIRERREQLNEKVNGLWSKMEPGQLSESMNELWTKIETDAREMRVSPEEALIASIRRCSATLNSYVGELLGKSLEIFPAAARPRLEATASYIEQLDSRLAGCQDISEVKDDLIDEAKTKLQEVSQWTSSFVSDKNAQQKTE